MRKLLTTSLLSLFTLIASAGDSLFSKPKLSGYIMGQYQASFQENNESNSFVLRMARVSVTGTIAGDFAYKAQLQVNGNTTTLGKSPRLVDAFAEWRRYSFARIKAGQFKNPFTFENPLNPFDQCFMSYSQVVSALAGFNDRAGTHPSNGRDIGLQVEGDVLNLPSGRPFLHYVVGVFNGQGINTNDVDNKKNVVGGLWVMPIEGMRVGVFGLAGSYARNGSWTDAAGQEQSGTVSLSQNRYAISAEWKRGDWMARAEYVHSTGKAFKTRHQHDGDETDANTNEAIGNKADGAYIACMAPIVKGKLRAAVRYDLYRKSASWADSRTQWDFGLIYNPHKNVELHGEYVFMNDRSLAKHNYSMLDFQVWVRF